MVTDRSGNLTIYLDNLAAMAGTISRGHGKTFHREKIGQQYLLAYDELKKMLAVVSPDKVRIRF